jgi:PAS domain S-box-containing protein
MLKKILNIIKATALLWGCILIPLVISIKFIQNSAKNDALQCIDSFIEDEGSGLSKYIALQFENSQNQIDNLWLEIERLELDGNEKEVKKHLTELLKSEKNIVDINLYHENGKFFVGTSKNPRKDLEIKNNDTKPAKDNNAKPAKSNDTKSAKNNDVKPEKSNDTKHTQNNDKFSIEQLEDGELIVVRLLREKEERQEEKSKKFFLEVVVKWDQYETYMNKMNQGAFPRMFYVISPDCKRYVSMNSLPASTVKQKTVIALGMHLADKILSINSGLSDIKIDACSFRLYKNEIQMPKNMGGNKFYIVVATNDDTFNTIAKEMMESVPVIFVILICSLLGLCIVLSRFYNRTKEELEIATTIADSTPLAIAIFKLSDGKIMRINLSAMTLFRIDKENSDSINLWKVFIYDDDRNYISSAASSNINVINYEVLAQSFGGGSFWAICSASPIDIQDEKYIVLAVLDINRRKEIEKKLANNAALLEQQVTERTADLEIKAKELEESNEKLEKAKSLADEASSAKSKFLTNMSNELKTPINAIIGYSEILLEEALDRKDTVSAEDLKKIIGSAKHLLSLIEEILDLSKIEAGKTQLFFENVEIESIIRDVEGITMPLITSNDNSLFLEYKKEIGSMYTDATKLRQCLLNLLSNAAKFTQFGKVTLHVSSMVKDGADFIEFAVIDTGIGIDPDKIDNIFEAFGNDKSKGSGAGLGLSLTKKYSEYLGGTLIVESEPNVGSKFVMRIPRTSSIKSSEFIEVKNYEINEEEIAKELMEDIEEAELSIESKSHSFGRKSDVT